jgi:diguanylate cyclase (GGDEF)-like protein
MNSVEQQSGWSNRLLSPFKISIPEVVRDRLTLLQVQRLDTIIPLLCLITIANTVAMTVAVLGDLPKWQQFTPPALIVGGGLMTLCYTRWRGPTQSPQGAEKQLSVTFLLAIAQGLIAGLWSVNAFTETEKYYCMVAPVFIGIAALINATCLLSVPRAAIAGIITTLMPITIKMAIYDNLGVRAMAVMLFFLGVMQAGVVLAKFRETVATLLAQHELDRLAHADSLTGIGNRLTFMKALDTRLAAKKPIWIMLADLDGFKQINDTNGHAAGDAVLVAVAHRLNALAGDAAIAARLGGDEFALLFEGVTERSIAELHVAALAQAITAPIAFSDKLLSVGMSVGVALAPIETDDSTALLALADQRLYANKAQRTGSGPANANMAA